MVEKQDRILEGQASIRSNIDGIRLNLDMLRLQVDRSAQNNHVANLSVVRSICIQCGANVLSKNMSRHLKTCSVASTSRNQFDINQPGTSSSTTDVIRKPPSISESDSDTSPLPEPPAKRGRGRGRGRPIKRN